MGTQTWSTEEIQSEFAQCRNLQEVIQSLESSLWSEGEVLCEVYVNGLALREEDEARFAGSDLSEIRELKVKSNSPAELVEQTLGSIREYVPDLLHQSDITANAFRTTAGNEAHTLLSELIDACHWLTDAIYLVRCQLKSWPEVQSKMDKWKVIEEKYAAALRSQLAAVEQKDAVLIADNLEYDLADALEDWRRLIPEVIEAMKSDKMPHAGESPSS